MLRAKDIMLKEVISVAKDTPIFEALELMAENDVTGIPVVEDDMTLVGFLSEKDAVVLFYESENADNKTVGDYMTSPAFCFEENEALLNVCDFLLKNIFRRIPVTSKGKVVGIISRADIIKYILRQWQGHIISAADTSE
jgi:CBS domain-containing protein